MSNDVLEKKIVGAMLDNQELKHRAEIKPEWFSDPLMQKVADVTLTMETNFTDLSEVQHEIKTRYPSLPVDEELLRALRFQKMLVDDFKASCLVLKKSYLQRKLTQASQEFSRQPNDMTKDNLMDWLIAVENAETPDDFGDLDQDIEELLYSLENEVEGGLRTYPLVDKILNDGLKGGTLFILGARPAIGKSAYAVNLAKLALENNENTHVDLFTLEMTKQEMLKRIVSLITGINNYKFVNAKHNLSNQEKAEVITAARWVDQSGLRIHDSRYKLSEIERMIRHNVHNHNGNYLAIVDYLGLIDAEDGRMQKREQIGKITRRMKMLTNELDIPIVMLSQLSRAVESRDSNEPFLSDLRESGDVEQDSSVVGFLYNDDEQEHIVNLKIAKNRSGATGVIPYEFHKASTYFEELDI